MNDVSQTALFTVQIRGAGGNLTHRSLPGRLSYAKTDPLAATITFAQDGLESTWVVGRDLLAQGLVRPAGEGDLRVEPEAVGRPGESGSSVKFTFAGKAGVGIAWLPTAHLRRFLAASYDVVTSGMEDIDVDAFIADCLKEVA